MHFSFKSRIIHLKLPFLHFKSIYLLIQRTAYILTIILRCYVFSNIYVHIQYLIFISLSYFIVGAKMTKKIGHHLWMFPIQQINRYLCVMATCLPSRLCYEIEHRWRRCSWQHFDTFKKESIVFKYSLRKCQFNSGNNKICFLQETT